MIYHVFANKTNVGDWLSARGIQSLLAPLEVAEHYCDAAFVRDTLRHLSRAGPKDLIVIGGGGLFQNYFLPFWEGLEPIAARVPFCIWGVGGCEAPPYVSMPSGPLLPRLAERARLCIVRDEMTRLYFEGLQLPPPVACPSIAVLGAAANKNREVLNAIHPDVISSAAGEAIRDLVKAFALQSRRDYYETDNRIQQAHSQGLEQVLDRYRRAELVVSSRLHGCIMALASGCKVLALGGDRKVEAFMRLAGLEDWVCAPDDPDSIRDRLTALEHQASRRDWLDRMVSTNHTVAGQVRQIIESEQIDPAIDPCRGGHESDRWDAAEVVLALEQLQQVIPPRERLILIDEGLYWGSDFKENRQALPFLEREGRDWGPPADDDSAIRELERMRREGARFMVFARPAFWWLDHYTGLMQHLRTHFRCVVENERVVVFNLT